MTLYLSSQQGRARGAAGGQSENTAASIGTTGTSTSPPGGGVGADSDGGVSAPRQALLYTATTDNPNFFLPSVEEAAGIIASAVGPSGPNHEYLLSLSEYMNKVRPAGGRWKEDSPTLDKSIRVRRK